MLSDQQYELPDEVRMEAGSDVQLNLYTMYFASQNSSAGGDGYITTQVPESGGQESMSALDSTIEFRTSPMLSSLDVAGRPNHGSGSGSYYLPLGLFMRATGPDTSSVEWTITLKASSTTVGSVSWSTDACNPGLTQSCSFDHETFEIDLGNDQRFTIDKNERLELLVDADMSGCESSGSPFGSSCEAEVAWNEIDGDDRFSTLEIEANAISNSLVLLQREGAELAEGPELEWFPNDILSERVMQFSFDVKSSFGRYDVDSVRLLMRDPDGVYRIDHVIDEDDEEIEDTSQGIFGEYLWSYPSGIPSGEYSVELEVSDIQGNSVIIEHEPVTMEQWGVALNHRLDRTTEYIAPGQTTPVPLQLVHRGDSTKSMEVELEVLTNFPSSWLLEFDSPVGYTLNAGGDILNPILTLTAPEDLTGAPGSIDIRAVAEAEVDGVLTVVHQDTLQIDLEKIDVYQPPQVSVWSEDHDVPIANSSRPDDIDSSIPRYVDHMEFTPFLLEIFNTGFDADTFRIDVLQRSKAIIHVYDNDTGQRILEDEGDGTFHTALLDRHDTQTLRLMIKPSADREDPDIGTVEIEVVSSGNASLRSTVLFTIQRTFGIRAEVSYDCDGSPLGHIRVSLCSPGTGNAEVSLRAKITNTMTSGESATWWRIQNPASLDENTDRNAAYGQWQFRIEDSSGNAVPRVSLAPGDETEVFVTIILTNQVEFGNHTVYLRIIEDTTDDDADYFDLPMVFEVDPDDPNLEIVQVTPNRLLVPGESYPIQMKVKNLGNSPLTVLLEAEVDGAGWSVDIDGPSNSVLIVLGAFEEVTFVLDVNVPESANNGETAEVLVTATPFDTQQSWPDDATAEKTVVMRVGISSLIDRLVNEITHPRLSTYIVGIVAAMLLIAGIQGAMNRRRWKAHMAYLDAISSDSDDDLEDEEDDDLPAPVVSIEEEEDDAYEDDDIELV
ncbi:MAG: hypothetical protein CMB53_02100 [Euryarchaeota archaeon]|nr:hypothetical protein [Euryarchaeota archaeon]